MSDYLERNAKIGDTILIHKHNFSICEGIREVIDMDKDTAYFNVKAPSSFNPSGYEFVKCGTPIDRYKRYENKPAYTVLNKEKI